MSIVVALSGGAAAADDDPLVKQIDDLTQAIKPNKVSPAAAVELQKLVVAINTAVKPPPMIYVVHASYGDLQAMRGGISRVYRSYVHSRGRRLIRVAWGSDRVCDATAAVRQACQTQTSCLADTSHPFSAATLCGYDPVPYADARHVGLSVAYACVATPDGWNPDVDHFVPPVKSAERRVTLRAGQALSIDCRPALDAAPKIVEGSR
jgi:hypothetical protein